LQGPFGQVHRALLALLVHTLYITHHRVCLVQLVFMEQVEVPLLIALGRSRALRVRMQLLELPPRRMHAHFALPAQHHPQEAHLKPHVLRVELENAGLELLV
jgi:hypothetical protein